MEPESSIVWRDDWNSSVSVDVGSGETQSWSNEAENWVAVEQLKVRLHWARALDSTGLQKKTTSNRTGIWSENILSQISRLDTDNPWERTRSSVWPCSCVGPDTYCTKLKESIRLKKSFTKGLQGQHTWMLKSPTKRIRSRHAILDRDRLEFKRRWPALFCELEASREFAFKYIVLI